VFVPRRFPSRPITMVVPVPAGGAMDTNARLVAEGMRTRLVIASRYKASWMRLRYGSLKAGITSSPAASPRCPWGSCSAFSSAGSAFDASAGRSSMAAWRSRVVASRAYRNLDAHTPAAVPIEALIVPRRILRFRSTSHNALESFTPLVTNFTSFVD
jgi:hypothetical protein